MAEDSKDPSASAGGSVLFSVGLVADVPGRPVGEARMVSSAFSLLDLGVLLAILELGSRGSTEAQLVADKTRELIGRAIGTLAGGAV